VVLTGTGSDELFNGYMNSYFGVIKDKDADLDKIVRNFILSYGFTNKEALASLRKLLKIKFTLSNTVNKVRDQAQNYLSTGNRIDRMNLHNYLYVTVHLAGWELPVADSMSMASSLETRTPFLDHQFVEYAVSLKGAYKYHQGQEKYILREAFKKHLPKIIYKREKVPFSKQVMSYLTSVYLNKFDNAFTSLNKYININEINKLDKIKDADLLWRLYVLAKWLEKTVTR
jgi:asparagine synthase (glutamine-hydrolysing)